MSTTTPHPPAAPTLGEELQGARQRLQQQRQRVRTGLWVEAVGVVALMLIAYALPTLLADRLLRLEWAYRAGLLLAFVGLAARVVLRRLVQPMAVPLSDEELALAVERSCPALDQQLISSLQFDEELANAQPTASIESREMKAAVVQNLRDRLQAVPFAQAIDTMRVQKFALGIFAMLTFFGAWAGLDRSSLGIWAARNVLLTDVDWPRYTVLSFVDGDGEVRLPQGDALTVRVRVEGPVPDQMFLDYAFADGDVGAEPMSLTGEDEFTWTIDAVVSDLDLSVQGGDALPVTLAVRVVERPTVGDLAIRVTLPDYMEREPFDVPPTEGDVRLPSGAELAVSGRSRKPLQEAFLLFGSDRKIPLALGADGRSFAGSFAPEASGLMVVDVIDADSLGAGTPPKLLLRVGEDKAPTVDFRLRGIGSSITYEARIPGALRVRDDFGLRAVSGTMRYQEDSLAERGEDAAPSPPMPWADAAPIYDAQLQRSALRYEAEASVDLLTWNKVRDQNSPENPIRPGMLFSLRYAATDNFGPGDPHEGFGETMTFRVVPRDQLIEELRRRQVEQRAELQQIADLEAAGTLELSETVNPDEAGDKQKQASAKFRVFARRQQALGRRVRFVGEAYQRILWELENNRLIEENKVRQIEAVITAPLGQLAKEAFPATSRLVSDFVRTREESVRGLAVEGYREISRRLAEIIKAMEQAETLAALLEELRNVINLETDAISDVKRRIKDREDSLFQRKKPKKN
ncbi:MAG: hypothetical protein ACON4Z_04175 [Planctomycetota bacterium]